VPGGLTVYLAFESGGFFPGAAGVTAVLLALLLIARVLLARDPFAGMSGPLAIVAGALMLLAAWTLASAAWSDSAARATLEFDRVLVYLLALALLGSLPRSAWTARRLVWGLAVGMTLVCTAGLITRTLPDVWAAPPELQRNRLSYPIGYWNAFGLMAAFALVFCLHISSSAREARAARVVAATAAPVLGVALLFTFSRGPIAVAALGVVVYAVLGRPRLLASGLLAIVPPTALAVAVAYNAELLARFTPGTGYEEPTRAVIEQGHEVALMVALCALAAALLRMICIAALDPTFERLRLKPRTRRRIAVAAATLALAGLAAGAVAVTRGDRLGEQYDRLVRDPVLQTGDYRDRLFNPGLARIDRWTVAVDAFSERPGAGHGAGTYQLLWERNRPNDSDSANAHNLYLEVLAELGLVGLLLLGVALVAILVGFAARLRGGDRTVYAAFLAAGVMWAVHASIDWDWELPVISLWLFAAGGAALARPVGTADEAAGQGTAGLTRALLALGVVVLAVTPARAALSEAYLAESLRAYDQRRWDDALDSADRSSAMLASRPEPRELQGYVQARDQSPADGLAAMNAAIERDPKNWEFHYGLALVQAGAGVDPLPAARTALGLNPREFRAQEAVRRFRSRNPADWPQAATRFGLSPRER
jgi:O-antigen ligase